MLSFVSPAHRITWRLPCQLRTQPPSPSGQSQHCTYMYCTQKSPPAHGCSLHARRRHSTNRKAWLLCDAMPCSRAKKEDIPSALSPLTHDGSQYSALEVKFAERWSAHTWLLLRSSATAPTRWCAHARPIPLSRLEPLSVAHEKLSIEARWVTGAGVGLWSLCGQGLPLARVPQQSGEAPPTDDKSLGARGARAG